MKNAQSELFAIPGDFDGNGRVDGNDFLAWQRGGADPSDLTVWKQHFANVDAFATAETVLAATSPSSATLTGVFSADIDEAFLEARAVGVATAPPRATARAGVDDIRFMWLAASDFKRERMHVSELFSSRKRERDGEGESHQTNRRRIDEFPELTASRNSTALMALRDNAAQRDEYEGSELASKDDVFSSAVDDLSAWRLSVD